MAITYGFACRGANLPRGVGQPAPSTLIVISLSPITTISQIAIYIG